MKSILPAFLFFIFLQASLTGRAQVSKLANNINPEFAIPLTNLAVVVTASDSLWRTNGTPAGTFKLTGDVAMDSTLSYAVLNNKIYFCGITAANGAELWVTDGTAAGTKLVKDINTAGNGRPRYFEVLNNAIFFFADNGTDGTELWKFDGATATASMVKNINPTGSSVPSFSIPLPPPLPSISQEFASQYFTKNNLLYFTATDGTNGVELWKTDGTSNGTSMLKNINTPAGASSYPSSFYAYGSEFLFTAYTNATGNELWKTDGTADGTALVKDIDPNNTNFPAYAPTIFGFTTFKNKVYFDARDGSHGYEGWVTDGTTDGTTLLKDINSGSKDGLPLFSDALFINNQMIFPATSADKGTELWVSDGTTNGTSLFKDINAGTKSSDPLIYLNSFGATSVDQFHSRLFNGIAFLRASTPDGGSELWKTNGTPDGTVRVKDINPGADSSLGDLNTFFSFYTANKFYVSATDGSTGYELWQSDGSEGNTSLLKDIFATADSSSFPQPVGGLNGIIFFSANDGDNKPGNRDLFRFDGTFESPLPVKLSQFGGEVVDKSVRLKWSTAQEINTSHFEIQRSIDGRNFQTIGKVTAAKNSSVKKDYSYDDVNALASGGKLFYQLKMVDGDGKATYSKILPFSKEFNGKLLTYPNPVRDELTVTASTGNRKQLSLSIFDASGKQVYSQRLASLQGSNTYPVPVSSFAKGTYYVKVITDDGVETSRFVKD